MTAREGAAERGAFHRLSTHHGPWGAIVLTLGRQALVPHVSALQRAFGIPPIGARDRLSRATVASGALGLREAGKLVARRACAQIVGA